MIPSLTTTSALTLLLFTLPILSQTQTPEYTSQITWASASYTYHGEKTPSFHPFSSSSNMHLTPLGASQLYSAGLGLRNRYIAPMNISQDKHPISGISVNRLDNSMLDVMAMEEPWVTGSALAFLQGLYPPFEGDGEGEEEVRGEGGLYGFPLNGYQYPRIATLSELDFNHIWYCRIAGQADCKEYFNSQVKSLSSPAYVDKIKDTQTYYSSFTSEVFPDRDESTINYANAWEVYEGALYAYRHNSTIHNSSTFTVEDLAILRSLASEQQWTFNTPMGSDLINAVSGRTLAAKILQKLNNNIASKGASSKLSLMFGTHEPFMAFFALSSLATGPSGPQFNTLPDHGSTMTFELFSTHSSSSTPNGDEDASTSTSTTMPPPDQLSVRFLFRNGSEPDSIMKAYTLFGRGNSETVIPWPEFQKLMGWIALTDILDWCRTCGTLTYFCQAFEDIASGDNEGSGGGGGNSQEGDLPGGKGRKREGISSTVGGVVGAVVVIVVLLVLVLALVGAGFRVERRKREGRDLGDVKVLKRASSGSGSGNAGFKGADRLGSDTDLAYKGGAGATIVRHERVGSWELGESPVGVGHGDSKHGSLDKEIESGFGANERVVSGTDYERRSRELARENPFVDPVMAVERV
ncbi:hypothetical protein VTL71DRAFT_14322 [Oculimacula yallundae]|uniref:Acid phosphatase n=1 Tax=Oculimacula yallundae TaxID=86028 RepID=A0ABR4CIA2_9HELO